MENPLFKISKATSRIMPHTLPVSESFYSIQGEGKCTGVPAVFLRLKGCNLSCGGINTIKTKSLDSGATWRCDTIEVWTKGETINIVDLLESWEQNGWLNHLKNGAHLVITGGEPLLWQDKLVKFLNDFKQFQSFLPFIEVETNGTITPTKKLDSFISQYNVSPKLKNSGMKKEDRLINEALTFFTESQKGYYKFVVSNQSDCDEITNSFIIPFKIPSQKIQLMPGAETKDDCLALSPQVVEWCKEKGLGFSSRLHLLLWDKKTGC
ncbi:7-carboxy-7-deazaguanine synthase QueE [Candidatus Marinamargulisbacteria bacterium SCGC AAA071-K20]|nr:7-carboxy-7-deazaguanine synthase QueE [Candidatus Marinamargulisbacteria bacterium SCGC AAA071-K20]